MGNLLKMERYQLLHNYFIGVGPSVSFSWDF